MVCALPDGGIEIDIYLGIVNSLFLYGGRFDLEFPAVHSIPSTSGTPSALYHKMFVFDANLQEPLPPSTFEEDTRTLVDNLIAALGMEKLNDLQISPATDLSEPGWSWIQPITTSHMAAHYFSNVPPHLHLDIYSCRDFSHGDVIRVLDDCLHLAGWSATLLLRDVDPAGRRYSEIAGNGKEVQRESPLSAQEDSVSREALTCPITESRPLSSF